MPEYDDTNRGAIFKNDKKLTDKHPDYKGTINVEGREFWVSSWISTSKAGMKYMSLSVQPKDDQPQTVKTEAQIDAEGFDDTIPF